MNSQSLISNSSYTHFIGACACVRVYLCLQSFRSHLKRLISTHAILNNCTLNTKRHYSLSCVICLREKIYFINALLSLRRQLSPVCCFLVSSFLSLRPHGQSLIFIFPSLYMLSRFPSSSVSYPEMFSFHFLWPWINVFVTHSTNVLYSLHVPRRHISVKSVVSSPFFLIGRVLHRSNN